jgi:hypothetical protein
MKIFRFLLFFLPITLVSKTPETQEKQPGSPKKGFSYVTLDGTIADLGFFGGGFSAGYRTIYQKHSGDINGGFFLGYSDQSTFTSLFIQSSYLFYPLGFSGPYVGAGVTLNFLIGFDHAMMINFPITLGYQFKKLQHPQFIQMQYGPTTASVTLSYGFGF